MTSDSKRRAFGAASQVLVFIALGAAVKVALALVQEPDPIETYHWLYGRHPAAGYFDHPGMIGWLIWLSTSLFGDSLLAIRLPTILGSGGAIWLAFLAGRKMYDERSGRLAALLVGLVPLTARFASEATPDGPLIFFWMATIWSLTHAIDSPAGAQSNHGWWILTGALAGAALDSKYTAAILPAGVLLYLALSPEHRFWLARLEPYVAAIVALAVFWPTIAWNAEQQWRSFEYQGVERVQAAGGFTWSYAGPFFKRQVALITPVILVWSVATGIRTAFRWRESHWADRLNVSLGLPLLLLFIGLSFFRSVRAHWPVVAYLSLFLAAAAAAERKGTWVLRLHQVTVGILALLGVALPVTFACAAPDQAKTWDSMASEIRARDPGFVMAGDYHDAALLAWHLQPLPTSDLSPLGLGVKSFPAWWQSQGLIGKDAILVTDGPIEAKPMTELKRCFDRIEGPEEVAVHPFAESAKVLLLWTARSFHPPSGETPSPLAELK